MSFTPEPALFSLLLNISAEEFLLQILIGVIMGSIYGLMAVGLTLIFGVMKVVNFAHGELYMIGGYSAYFLMAVYQLPAYLALPAAVGIGFGVGYGIERLLLRPMHSRRMERPVEYSVIVTFGLLILLQNLAIVLFGPYVRKPPTYWEASFSLGLINIGGDRVFALGSALILLTLVLVVIKKTWVGRALMGVAQNKFGALISGIDSKQANSLAFGIGAALAAASGALLAPLFLVFPDSGTSPVVKAFVIIVLGGMGSIAGSLIGGVLLGVIESMGSVLYSPSYKEVYGFIILIIVLVLRPWGLLGERERWA